LQERVAVETDDEVGTLAEGFNVMAAHLEGKFAELQTESAFIEEVLDGLPVGVAVLDASLLVRKANPTFARFVGREPNSLKGRGIYEAAAGLAVLSEVIEDVRRTRKPFVTYSLPLGLIATRGDKEGEGKTESANNFWDITLWPTTKRSAERGDLIFVLSEVSKRARGETRDCRFQCRTHARRRTRKRYQSDERRRRYHRPTGTLSRQRSGEENHRTPAKRSARRRAGTHRRHFAQRHGRARDTRNGNAARSCAVAARANRRRATENHR
jgi:PAS domain-containing protein